VRPCNQGRDLYDAQRNTKIKQSQPDAQQKEKQQHSLGGAVHMVAPAQQHRVNMEWTHSSKQVTRDADERELAIDAALKRIRDAGFARVSRHAVAPRAVLQNKQRR
jgi:hypothetical protein